MFKLPPGKWDSNQKRFLSRVSFSVIKMLKPYNMKNVADKITCHMLVVDSEKDMDMPGQAKQLYDALKCPKDFMLFTVEEGAEEHCQVGATMISNERILNWLDDTLKKTK